MKCNAHTFWGIERRKNAKKTPKIVGILHDNLRSTTTAEELRNTLDRIYSLKSEEEVCGGDLEVVMESNDYGCCHYDETTPVVICKKCGNRSFHVELDGELVDLNSTLEYHTEKIMTKFVQEL